MADESITSNTANIPYVNMAEQGSDPTTPATGRAALYVKGGALYVRLDDGTVVPVGGSVALAEGRLAIGDGSGVLSALALGTEGQLVTADASGHATWDDAPEGGGGGGGSPFDLWPHNYSGYTGSAPTYTVNTGAIFTGYLTRGAYANADSLTWTLDLPAGTYTVRCLYGKGALGAIADLTLAGASVGSLDYYTAIAAFNYITTFTGIVVAASGLASFVHTVNGKNAGSGGYYTYLQHISLWRTA